VLLWRILEPKHVEDFSGRFVVEKGIISSIVADVEQDRGRGKNQENYEIL
jgi:hypothetical protein